MTDAAVLAFSFRNGSGLLWTLMARKYPSLAECPWSSSYFLAVESIAWDDEMPAFSCMLANWAIGGPVSRDNRRVGWRGHDDRLFPMHCYIILPGAYFPWLPSGRWLGWRSSEVSAVCVLFGEACEHCKGGGCLSSILMFCMTREDDLHIGWNIDGISFAPNSLLVTCRTGIRHVEQKKWQRKNCLASLPTLGGWPNFSQSPIGQYN